jgi:hypothetical protein
MDSAEAPGGWVLIGDQRMLELLAKCKIPFATDEPS